MYEVRKKWNLEDEDDIMVEIDLIYKSEFVEESNLLVLNKLERLLTVCKVKNIDDIDFRCFKPKENYTRSELLA